MPSTDGTKATDCRALARFCVVGTVGFVVDSGATVALVRAAGFDVMTGRVLAFVVAATVTWQLNRRYTFRSTAGASSWLLYVALTSVGGLINLGTYRAWIAIAGSSATQIVAGIAVGSLVALAFNFVASRRILG